nr:MAG TPA: hypothetical protein [Bacteriophage sp.]
MDKPITVARQEFTQQLVNLVNNSGLPAFVMRSALSQVDTALAQLEQAQLEKDTAEWESQQKEVTNG